MLSNDVTNAGANPALEALIKFAGQRQRLLAHNIANLDTPNFEPLDVSVPAFQRALREAIDRRRDATGNVGELELQGTHEFHVDACGDIALTPHTPSGNILFHDRNNRDLERSMQDMVENFGAFQVASTLLKSNNDTIRAAIDERP